MLTCYAIGARYSLTECTLSVYQMGEGVVNPKTGIIQRGFVALQYMLDSKTKEKKEKAHVV